MGVVDKEGKEIPSVREDVLHVFHGDNGKHAGTLTFTEEIYRYGPGSSWTWTWIGGPLGPLGGIWDHQLLRPDMKLCFHLRLYDSIERPRGLRAVLNSAWSNSGALPARPWFKKGDAIHLLDSNFKTPGSPDGHMFKCTMVRSPA